MNPDTDVQAERARIFHALHAGPLLIVANAWDVLTARVFEDSGFTAVGTTSFGIARAHGFRDGAGEAFEVTVAMTRRMTAALGIPLSVDMEAGFGASPETVAAHARAFLEAGAVGFNLEDGEPGGGLADPSLQAERVAAVQEAARTHGVPAFLNARTDVLWLGGTGPAALTEALRRAEIYLRAGADGVFIPGLRDRAEIRRAVQELSAPLNVLAHPELPPPAELAEFGVRRLSLGSGPVRATLGLLRTVSRSLREGSWSWLDGAIPYDEANRL